MYGALWACSARSHVFPFNRMGAEHLSVLGAGGITAVRWRISPLRPLVSGSRRRGSISAHRELESSATTLLPLRRVGRGVAWRGNIDDTRSSMRGFIHQTQQTFSRMNSWPSSIATTTDAIRDRRWLTTMAALAAYCEARETDRHFCPTGARISRVMVSLSSQFNAARYGRYTLLITLPGSRYARRSIITSRD